MTPKRGKTMPQYENDPRARDAAMHDAKRFEQTTEPS